MEAKDILYHIIEQMGQDKIRTLLNIDIVNSKKIIEQIFEKYYNFLDSFSDESLSEHLDLDFTESLLHFLLTASVIPSQRKITYNDIEFDVIIPNLIILKTNPEKSMVLFIDKQESNVKSKINKLNTFLYLKSNLLIIGKYNHYQDCNNYCLPLNNVLEKNNHTNLNSEINQNIHKFEDILVDISKFLSQNNDKSFKILHM